MNKSVLLDANFSGLEQRVIAHYRNQSKAVMTTHDMVVSTTTNDLADAVTYGLNPNWLFGDDLYLQTTPHCQKKVFNIIDKFWSGKQLGLYGQYIEQLNRNPKTKDVFKGKSTTHHYPWYRRGTKY